MYLVKHNYTGSHLFVNVMFIGTHLVIWSVANGQAYYYLWL